MAVSLDLGDTRLIIMVAHERHVLRNQLAYILSTARWETAHTMKPVREAFWKSEAWRKKRLRYYPWYGRGYVQLTWKKNYIRAAQALNMDLTTDPDVVMKPEIAAHILVAGSMGGWFTGKKIGDYITLKKSDYNNARKVINGMDKAENIARLARDYEEALLVDGYGVDRPAMPPDVPGPDKPKVPGLDKPMVESKTLWSTIISAGGALLAAFGNLDWRVQMAVLAVVAGALVFIVVERKKHRDNARRLGL